MKLSRLLWPIMMASACLLGLWGWLHPSRVSSTAVTQGPIDAELQNALADVPPEGVRFMVHLPAQANLRRDSLPGDEVARRRELVQRLQETAVSSQRPLFPLLQELQAAGHIQSYRPLWIVNAIAITGDETAVATLAQRPEIAHLRLDATYPLTLPLPGPASRLPQGPVLTPDTAAQSWGIRQIAAPYVWDALGIVGSGVVVGIMDSGVDWQHPDLLPNYRGNLGGGSVQHAGNWYYAPDPNQIVPFDALGHGTHVAGTAVGQNGLGVAPGAQWIAVGIADPAGFIFDSAIHAGFQWLLAPNGDPALAPDVVNGSWGNPIGLSLTFWEDILTLQTAGIVTVFAAGNRGPLAGSLYAPASYPAPITVAASDDVDQVTWFSSRGPSPFADVKPEVAAPGTRILSALPDGHYGYYNGTSMAAPHVAGTVALLLSANPTLTDGELKTVLTSTAVPLSSTIPNQLAGWGRIDAYTAVASQVNVGVLQGVVRHNGTPLPGVTVTLTTPAGAALPFVTDTQGHYRALLRPGTYGLLVTNFGYQPVAVPGIPVMAGQTTGQDFTLVALPGGQITGQVRGAETQQPVTATLRVMGTPVVVTTTTDGGYDLRLPSGEYTLLVEAVGYQVQRREMQVATGQMQVQDFHLPSAPTILLIDAGQWYYNSYIRFYETALQDAGYGRARWTIRNPFTDLPSLAALTPYQVVVWADPISSPGVIGAETAVSAYLEAGGNLLISGQELGYLDGLGFYTQAWWQEQLAARYLGELYTDPLPAISGLAGTPFAGIGLDLNGGDGATNQVHPDVAVPRSDSLTQAIFAYEGQAAAGLMAGLCEPFRIVYTGFGLEGVSQRADRSGIVTQALAYFQGARQGTAVAWNTPNADEFAIPATHLTYTLTLRNMNELITDTFTLTWHSQAWAAGLLTQTLTLGPCQRGQTVLTLAVPPGLAADVTHGVTVTAVSQANPLVTATYHLRHKTPGQILLVDDDRWYEREAPYQAALAELGLRYDYWDTGGVDNLPGRGSPPADLLPYYQLVIWFTGADWYAPITAAERAALTDYLAGGGRLFLSSQDYLYYHHNTSLTRDYLGVIAYGESVTPTRVYGSAHPAVQGEWGEAAVLDYGTTLNSADGVIPSPDTLSVAQSRPFIWQDQGWAAGVATAGPTWRTVFWSVPFDLLPDTAQLPAMNSILGWLSDLGASTFVADAFTGAVGVPRTFTLTVQNLAPAPTHTVTLTNLLPVGLEILPGSLTGGAVYDPGQRRVSWQGVLPAGGRQVITYAAVPQVGLLPGTRLENRVWLADEGWGWQFWRTAELWIEVPDVGSSWLAATAVSHLPQQTLTYTLHLENRGLVAAPVVSATLRLPDSFAPLTETLRVSAGTAVWQGPRVMWQGGLEVGTAVTVSVALTRTVTVESMWVMGTVVIDDGRTFPLVRANTQFLPPYQSYLPIIYRP